MRQFVLKLVLFLAPLLGVWMFLEWKLAHYPNTLMQKRAFLERQAPTLRVFVVGTSVEYGGVSPSQFDCPGINMANPFQTIFLNAEIVRRFAPILPQLRLVLFGISYGAFEAQLGDSPASEAAYLYRHFLGTPLDSGINFWDPRTFSVVAAYGQDLALGQLFSGFGLPVTDNFDSSGWLSAEGVFDPGREAEIVPLVDRLQAPLKLEHIAENVHAVENMFALLQPRHVETVFITAPATIQIRRHLDTVRLERTEALINDLAARYHTTYMNYFTDPRFTTEDFRDPMHFNRNGALKFSRILNEDIIRPRGICAADRVASPDEPSTSGPGAPEASPAVPTPS